MCGRFTLSIPEIRIVTETALASVSEEDAAHYRPRYNIAPTQPHWIVIPNDKSKLLVGANWGWTQGANLLINLRAETIEAKDVYYDRLRSHPCLIPADGFYEWKTEGKTKRPYWFHAANRSLFWMAGVYWSPLPDELYFTIITTQANADMTSFHDRMPVLLTPDRFAQWWEHPHTLVKENPSLPLQAYAVSTRVNSVANDDPTCLDPFIEAPADPQLPLF